MWQRHWDTWPFDDATPYCSPDPTNCSPGCAPPASETSHFYEIIVERHRAKTTIVTSNREPAEWLTMTADTLLAQSAIDRLTATAHTLIIEGPSYRQRTRG